MNVAFCDALCRQSRMNANVLYNAKAVFPLQSMKTGGSNFPFYATEFLLLAVNRELDVSVLPEFDFEPNSSFWKAKLANAIQVVHQASSLFPLVNVSEYLDSQGLLQLFAGVSCLAPNAIFVKTLQKCYVYTMSQSSIKTQTNLLADIIACLILIGLSSAIGMGSPCNMSDSSIC